MKVAIVGSRTVHDFNLLEYYGLGAIETMGFRIEDITEIISGGAEGVDYLAKLLSGKLRITCTEFFAQWEKYGKLAGFKRNQLIVDDCDCAIVVWDGQSNGTRDTIAKLIDAKKPHVVIYTPRLSFFSPAAWERLRNEIHKPEKQNTVRRRTVDKGTAGTGGRDTKESTTRRKRQPVRLESGGRTGKRKTNRTTAKRKTNNRSKA